MVQNIDYIKSVTIDGRNNKTLSIRYDNVTCRWNPSEKRVLNDKQELVTSSVEVWLPAEYEDVSYSDIIVKNSVNYQIARKIPRYDLMGNLDHIKLYLI